jgi:hypothetical protein
MRVRIVGRTPDIAPLIRATISGEQIAGAGAGRGIDDLIMAGWLRCGRQACLLLLCTIENVDDRVAGQDQIISDDAPVAAPPQQLGAHDRTSLRRANLLQSDKPVVKRFRHGVIGKIAEALIFPERVRRSGKQVLASAPATQFRDMDVIDPIFAQRLRQAIPIELRVGSRTRNGAHIDQHSDIAALQYLDELVSRAGGMTDGKECRQNDLLIRLVR